MSDPWAHDPDLLAAEYVLGSLTSEERAAFEARLATEPTLQSSVAQWGERLQPLAGALPPSAPPARVWAVIEQALDAPHAEANVIPLRQRRARPRWWFAASLGMAVALALTFVLVPWHRPHPPVSVALLAPAEAGAAAAYKVALVDNAAAVIVVPGSVTLAGGKSHELWIVPASGAPLSLGLVDPSGKVRREVPPAARGLLVPGVLLAISLEPPGGSPTGAPTGPILFTGKLAAPAAG